MECYILVSHVFLCHSGSVCPVGCLCVSVSELFAEMVLGVVVECYVIVECVGRC